MRHALANAALAALAACGPGETTPATDATPEARTHALGMSDVSILLPLPADPHAPVLLTLAGSDDTPLAWQGLFESLVLAPFDIQPKNLLPFDFADMQLVAVRFDPCDGTVVGDCPDTSDGRLRLVFQPMYQTGSAVFAQDVAVHAFYPIANADLADAVADLRALAALGGGPADAPLGVAPGARDPVYLAQLRAFVLRHASWDRVVRMTVIGQEANSGAVGWVMRGFDRTPGGGPYAYTSIAIPEVNAARQTVLTAGGDVIYRTEPCADLPSGFALALNGEEFMAAGSAYRLQALAALEEAQNPLLHDAVDSQCAACHLSTFLTTRRAGELAIDPTTLPQTYAPPYDVRVATIDNQDPRVIRAFGWIDDQPAISQRVANDTAHVLAQIARRFP